MYIQIGGCCCVVHKDCNGTDITLPTPVTVTFAGVNADCSWPQGAGNAILANNPFWSSVSGSCPTSGAFPGSAVENKSYSLRFGGFIDSGTNQCDVCYELGTMTIADIRSAYGITPPGSDGCGTFKYSFVGSCTFTATDSSTGCTFTYDVDAYLALTLYHRITVGGSGATDMSLAVHSIYVATVTASSDTVGCGAIGSSFLVLVQGLQSAYNALAGIDGCSSSVTNPGTPCPGSSTGVILTCSDPVSGGAWPISVTVVETYPEVHWNGSDTIGCCGTPTITIAS